MRRSVLYHLLLLALPSPFRERHGPAMEEAFDEMYRHAREAGRKDVLALWLAEGWDLFRTGARLRTESRERERRRGGVTMGRNRRGTRSSAADFGDDLRFAGRALARNRRFTLFAALTMAVGIGASTIAFAALEGVVFHPFPFEGADRLYSLWRPGDEGSGVLMGPTGAHWEVWSTAGDVFEGIEVYREDADVLTGAGEPESLSALLVRPSLPAFLGTPPILGRTFTEEETAGDGARVVLLSHALWKERFGGDHGVLGRVISLDGEPWTVIGVMPPRVGRPSGSPGSVDLWRPLPSGDDMRWVLVVARLRQGVTVEAALASLTRAAERHASEVGGSPDAWRGTLQSAFTLGRAQAADTLRLLSVAVGLLFLVGCVNVASLLLHRGTTRRQETAIRTAVGAGRGRLLRQFLLESVMLSALGGLLGLALAYWGVEALAALRPGEMEALEAIRVDATVVYFAIVLSALAGFASGLVPALQVAGSGRMDSLRPGAHGTRSGVVGPRVRWTLVAAEVALSTALLVGSLAVTRALLELRQRDPGFRAEGLAIASLELPSWRYADAADAADVIERMRSRIETLPAVDRAVLAGGVPPRLGIAFGQLRVEDGERGKAMTVFYGNPVSPGYFAVLGQRIVEGREFLEEDLDAGYEPVVIGESTAARLFPGRDPIGRHFDLGSDPYTVVGVAQDLRVSGLRSEVGELQLFSLMDAPRRSATILVRTSSEARGPLLDAMRSTVLAEDPETLVRRLGSAETMLLDTVARERFATMVMAIFATLALALSAVGLYGVVSQIVAQRTREIGIRISLGADARGISRLVLSAGTTATAIGLVGGVALAVAGIRVLSTQLFGLDGVQPAAVAAAAAAMAFVALAACWIPARRATRVDPVNAIHAG